MQDIEGVDRRGSRIENLCVLPVVRSRISISGLLGLARLARLLLNAAVSIWSICVCSSTPLDVPSKNRDDALVVVGGVRDLAAI